MLPYVYGHIFTTNPIGSQQPTDDSLKGAESKDSRPVVGGLLRVKLTMSKADLQVENGNFTRIVNPLIEQLIQIPFRGCELAIAMFVIRKTYGYQKKKDSISLSQFCVGTKRSRQTVIVAIRNLELSNILVKTARPYATNTYEINKYYDTWKVGKTARLVKRRHGGSQYGSPKVVKTARHTKEIKKVTKETASQSEGVTISSIIDLFKEVNPTYERLFGMPPQRAATDRLLVKFGEEKLTAMVRFLPKSNASLYAPTITTPAQLERDLGRLVAWSEKQKDIKKTNVAFI